MTLRTEVLDRRLSEMLQDVCSLTTDWLLHNKHHHPSETAAPVALPGFGSQGFPTLTSDRLTNSWDLKRSRAARHTSSKRIQNARNVVTASPSKAARLTANAKERADRMLA